jgi:hypothetical protein
VSGGFSIRTLTKTGQRYSSGESPLAVLMMIDLNGPDIEAVDEVKALILEYSYQCVEELQDEMPSRSSAGVTRPSKSAQGRSNVYSQLSGLEDVVFNDFIKDDFIQEGGGQVASGNCSLPS